jgi:1,6-anhydro-N-acetylmuramate kinase
MSLMAPGGKWWLGAVCASDAAEASMAMRLRAARLLAARARRKLISCGGALRAGIRAARCHVRPRLGLIGPHRETHPEKRRKLQLPSATASASGRRTSHDKTDLLAAAHVQAPRHSLSAKANKYSL